MAVKVADNFQQSNRPNLLFTSDWYYLMDASDIDIGVEAILENSGESLVETVNTKYIVRYANNKPAGLASLTALENNDIVRYTGTSWEIHKDVTNTETNFGIVFDKRTKLFYQYDPTNGWKSLLRSGKIDGGTFGNP